MLNKLNKINKKIRVGRGIGSGKGKTSAVAIKDKNQDLVLQLKVLRAVKCLCTEDCLKEVLNH